jgi:UDP-N-acetylglucosamine:LPS N-acetylglucosamine transferase
MGGIPAIWDRFREWDISGKDICFIIPGGAPSLEIYENLILLPHHSEFFHPDLINACNAVVGKVGYSTLAEVFHAGVPFGYILRTFFRESEILGDFIEREMSGIPIKETEFHSGAWISCLEKLFSLPRIQRHDPNGSEQAGDFIYKLLDS